MVKGYETSPDMKGLVMYRNDKLLAAMLDWQSKLALADRDIDEHLDDLQIQGDATAADLYREVVWGLWCVIRSSEQLSKTMHTRLDWF
jgi:hypothetical protein